MNIFSRRHPTLPVEGKIAGLAYCMFSFNVINITRLF